MSLHHIVDLLCGGGVVVLSGAGLSTESGIPDYRGPSGSLRRGHQPMTYQVFTRDPWGRRRYWARSHLGWEYLAHVQPNAGHRAVAAMEQAGVVSGVITQNVDGLHQAAGSTAVIDLHGRLDSVTCLSCGLTVPRAQVQARLAAANSAWRPSVGTVNPDGDVELSDEDVASFREVGCTQCEGVLKPDVVYFGENVPPARVRQSYAMVDEAATLLVLGSSLTVFSGRRFVMHAQRMGIPVAIINQGPTRCDDIATARHDGALGEVLPALASSLRGVAAH